MQKNTLYSKFREYVKKLTFYFDVFKAELKIFKKNKKHKVISRTTTVLECGILQAQ